MNDENSLKIQRELYEHVTETPHFVISLSYEGFSIHFDDIYFNKLPSIIAALDEMKRNRNGEVFFDGGFRFNMKVLSLPNGSVTMSFYAEPSDFPGRLTMEGSFSVDGEYVESVLTRLVRLLEEGGSVTIP